MSFPKSVEERALVACGRHCCICHKFCGTKIELHHIKQRAYGGEDTFENCIPLCFDCHADMGKADPKHARGKNYSEKELKQHRDFWYKQQTYLNQDAKCEEHHTRENAVVIEEHSNVVANYVKQKWLEAAIDKKIKERLR